LINKKLLEEVGQLLIDFAGQSDAFIFDSQEKRRLIIDDLCSQEYRETSERIKSIWGETKVLKRLMDEKIEFSRNQEEKNLVIQKKCLFYCCGVKKIILFLYFLVKRLQICIDG